MNLTPVVRSEEFRWGNVTTSQADSIHQRMHIYYDLRYRTTQSGRDEKAQLSKRKPTNGNTVSGLSYHPR